MRIALVGYGKMGKAIEQIAKNRGNEISKIIDVSNQDEVDQITPENTDVAIEFTQPSSALNNIKTLITNRVPVVCGTTGWLENLAEVEALVERQKTGFFYASNFSIGVNLFFNINKQLAKLINGFSEYDVEMEEIHHIHKLDAPSGTAITLAEGIIENLDSKTDWKLGSAPKPTDIKIKDVREGEIPGTHIINYNSEIDSIEIKHTAHSRQGFATGAVVAAEWMKGKEGMCGMNDLLKL